MTVQFRAATSGSGGTSTNVVLNRPAGVIEGDLLVAVLGSDRDGTLAAMTAPAGWTERGAHTQTSCGFVKVWTKVAGASEPTSYTFPDSTSADAVGGMLAFHSYDPSAPLAVAPVFASSATAATSHPAPSVTGVEGGMLVTAHFGGANANATRSYTPPSGMTERVDVGPSSWTVLGVNTQSLTAAGATGTKTATCSASVPYITTTLVVAPTSATPVTVTDTPHAAAAGTPRETLDIVVDPNVTRVDSPAGAQVGTPRDVLAVGVTRLDTPGSGGAGNPPSARLIDQAALPSSGELAVLWWAIHPTTGTRVALPDVASWTLSPILNSPGALSLNYPADGLNFATLDQFVTERRDLEVEIWFRGRAQGALRGVLCEKSGDLVEAGAVWSFGGHFLEHLMSQIVVAPHAPDPKKETVFSAVSPGTVMATLMQRAHARGTATDITFGSFSATVDSNGVAWDKSVTATLSPVQTTYLQVLDSLVEQGACEWEITPAHELRLYVAGSRGVDRTVGANPVVLRRGRNLTDVPSKVSSRDGGTDLWGVGGEGLYHLEFDATARATRGRQVERAFSANGVNDAGALDALTTAKLPAITGGVREVTHGILFGVDDPLPLTGFNIGDWVYSNPGKGSTGAGGGNERLRLKQWSLSRDAARKYTGTITLNDLYAEQLVQLQRRLAALQGGQLVVGTSTPPPADDNVPPAAPTGVVVNSEWFADESGLTGYAAVYVSWSAVTTNADGTPITDLAGYRVRWRRAVGPSGPGPWTVLTPTSSTSASFTAGAGVAVQIEVAAHDRAGNISAWSATVEIVTETDTTAPPTPSMPTLDPYLGQLRIKWNGLGSAGEVMPRDLDRVEVHLSQASNFTPTAATRIDHFSAVSGERIATDLSYGVTYFVRLVAVDRSGNASAPSAQASAAPEQVVGADIFNGAVGSAKLADLAVITAKIDNLAVNDAKVGNLSVGKLTAGVLSVAVTNSGIIRSGTTGQRYELDAAALRFYDSAGTQTVQLNGATNWVSGEIRSALTGPRFVINPGGAAPDELRFYPNSGNQYGVMTTVTSTGDFGPQSGLSVKAHSGRADNFSGQLQVYPDYAAMSWGATSIQTVPHQISMLAPRFHFAVDRDSAYADDGVMRFGTRDPNVTAGFINVTVIEYQTSSGNEPSWRVPSRDVGLAFGTSFTGSINGASSAYVPHRASAFNVFTSTRATKTDIADLDYPGGALAVLRRAKVQKWRRINEVAAAPPGRPARVHIGPMADDLPPEVVPVDAEQGIAGVDLGGLLGLVHAGVTELAERVDALTAQVNTLTAAGGGRRP